MEIVPELAAQAMRAGLEKYPRFAALGPRLVARALYQGSALMLEYTTQPAPGDADAWEFQNAVVKTYKGLASA